MPLDMTGPSRFDREVHWRRYLDRKDQISVICVQDFDYVDYDPSRFVDLRAFPTEEAAKSTPLRVSDVIEVAAGSPQDAVAAEQAARLIAAIGAHHSFARLNSDDVLYPDALVAELRRAILDTFTEWRVFTVPAALTFPAVDVVGGGLAWDTGGAVFHFSDGVDKEAPVDFLCTPVEDALAALSDCSIRHDPAGLRISLVQ